MCDLGRCIGGMGDRKMAEHQATRALSKGGSLQTFKENGVIGFAIIFHVF